MGSGATALPTEDAWDRPGPRAARSPACTSPWRTRTPTGSARSSCRPVAVLRLPGRGRRSAGRRAAPDRGPRAPRRGGPPGRRGPPHGPHRARRREHRARPRSRPSSRRIPRSPRPPSSGVRTPPGARSRSPPSSCARAPPDPGDEALVEHARASLAGFKVPAAVRPPRRPAADDRAASSAARRSARCSRASEPASWRGPAATPSAGGSPGRARRPSSSSTGRSRRAAQLDRLAAALAAPGDVTVHALDRRGSGSSRLAGAAAPRRRGPRRRPRRLPGRTRHRAARPSSASASAACSPWSWPPGARTGFARWSRTSRRTASSRTTRGVAWFPEVAARHGAGPRVTAAPPAAAETFLRSGRRRRGLGAPARRGRGRSWSGRETARWPTPRLTGPRPGRPAPGSSRPVAILTGGASEPFYAPIADALAARIPGARRDTLERPAPSSPDHRARRRGRRRPHPAWSPPHDRPAPARPHAVRRLDRRRQRRRAAGGAGDVRPDRRRATTS